jgi:hypothetical protein
MCSFSLISYGDIRKTVNIYNEIVTGISILNKLLNNIAEFWGIKKSRGLAGGVSVPTIT